MTIIEKILMKTMSFLFRIRFFDFNIIVPTERFVGEWLPIGLFFVS